MNSSLLRGETRDGVCVELFYWLPKLFFVIIGLSQLLTPLSLDW